MNIALVGFGAMGRRIREIAQERGHVISAVIDPSEENATAADITPETLGNVDVVIEFTHPSVAVGNIEKICAAGKNLVVGTTGWHDRLSNVEKMVRDSDIGFLWSSNFSIGVNMYLKIVEAAAKLVNRFDEYDVWGNEIHHRNKADSPSGTAKALSKILIDNIGRKTSVIEEKLDRKIEPHEFHFSSTRGGLVNFAHTVGFDSAADTVTISHAARNRDGYALGAVKAAEWLKGKKGFFGMQDFLGSLNL